LSSLRRFSSQSTQVGTW